MVEEEVVARANRREITEEMEVDTAMVVIILAIQVLCTNIRDLKREEEVHNSKTSYNQGILECRKVQVLVVVVGDWVIRAGVAAQFENDSCMQLIKEMELCTARRQLV